ncbi:MAG: lipoyl(octanoyl) transferase LipB [Herminiimonas sp.]|nr:lipoyl(octanoyl) transferase LipB [Herminiimonas sp.]
MSSPTGTGSTTLAATAAADLPAGTLPAVVILDRGREAYALTYAAMRAFTDSRTDGTPDQLWIVEHPPVFTLGLGADPAHVLDAGPIAVIQTDRGGEVTYHGPGQAIVYLLVDLRRGAPGARLFAREFVRRIEQAVIDTLAAYNLTGERHDGAPGIYLADGPQNGAKVAALGLKVRGNGCTYHGVSLNVAMDMTAFDRINACGYPGLASTDMRSQGVNASLQEVQQTLAAQLRHNITSR